MSITPVTPSLAPEPLTEDLIAALIYEADTGHSRRDFDPLDEDADWYLETASRMFPTLLAREAAAYEEGRLDGYAQAHEESVPEDQR